MQDPTTKRPPIDQLHPEGIIGDAASFDAFLQGETVHPEQPHGWVVDPHSATYRGLLELAAAEPDAHENTPGS